jgi:hypothetical protein
MPNDSFIQVAPDNTEGKRVDMDLVASAAGATLYRQRAVLVGETGNDLQRLLAINTQQLAVLRAMLAILSESSTANITESDFDESYSPQNDR